MPKRPVIFFDFDNTITTFDILDDMLERFSGDGSWMVLEKAWNGGRIGSLECLKGQVEGINVKKKVLDRYLDSIKIDPYFKKLVKLFEEKNVKTFILSDNFDYILRRILKNNRISGIKIYSNTLCMKNSRLKPLFPLTNNSCGNCAHCKKTSLLKNTNASSAPVYIGDGRSDVCVSEEADLLFAKGYLKDYCRRKRMPHIPFNSLKEVHSYFKDQDIDE